jgi:hypothetical protein
MSWRTRKWWNLASPLLVYKVQGLQGEHEARVAGQVNASQCDSCETCSDHLESSRELPPGPGGVGEHRRSGQRRSARATGPGRDDPSPATGC